MTLKPFAANEFCTSSGDVGVFHWSAMDSRGSGRRGRTAAYTANPTANSRTAATPVATRGCLCGRRLYQVRRSVRNLVCRRWRRSKGTGTCRMARPSWRSTRYSPCASAPHSAQSTKWSLRASAAQASSSAALGREKARKRRAVLQSMIRSPSAVGDHYHGRLDQPIAQVGLGPCQTRHHRAQRQIHLFGDVPITEILKIVQNHRRSEALRQFIESLLQPFRIDLRQGARRALGEVIDVRERDAMPILLRPHLV